MCPAVPGELQEISISQPVLQKWLIAAGLAAAIPTSARVPADDWPQWRGPHRDGVYAESGLLESFPSAGLTVKWRAPVGWGFSSPIVAGGRVYLADSELAQPAAKERLLCFSEENGKSLWTQSTEADYPEWAFDPTQEIGPVATPIAQAGQVYTVGRLGDVICRDARTGDPVWQRNMGRDYGVEFAAGAPSPLIEGDLLILMAGGKQGACVVAFDKATGREAWKALDESPTFSSPIVIMAGGARQLIVWTQESVTSLNPLTGETYWRQRLLTNGDYAVSTPVWRADRLLIGGLMFALDPEQPAASVLWPASSAPARRIYSHTSTALLQGDSIYTAKSSGEFICVDAHTGDVVWETDQVTRLKGGATVHLTSLGDSALLLTDEGQLIRARLTPLGYEEISRTMVLEPTFPFGGTKVEWSAPAFANRCIFVRNGQELLCARLADSP